MNLVKKTKAKMAKILIMEDEPILSLALTIELNSYGYKVFAVDNGVDGLKIFYKEKPDLILLDLLMPKKDGYEVLEELKAKKLLHGLKVIVLSNLGQDDEKKRAIALGAKNFFVKSSIDLEDLTSFIGKMLA
ncbi:MAG: response regulator [Candidatus Gracilibacteria bacterium]